jgi:hypothetical protein
MIYAYDPDTGKVTCRRETRAELDDLSRRLGGGQSLTFYHPTARGERQTDVPPPSTKKP